MPVVISIYNAPYWLAVALDGFVLQNPALMIAGMVVGAAGMFLTLIMAQAMNRSVSNILFSDFGDATKHKQGAIKGSLKPVGRRTRHLHALRQERDHRAGLRSCGRSAQQKLYEFVKLLQAAGVEVRLPFTLWPDVCRGQMDVC